MLALGSVCSLGVSKATPDANSALSIRPSNNLNSPFRIGATGSLSGSKSSPLPRKKAVAWSRGSYIPQVPATQRCACAPRAGNKHPELVHTRACAVTHLAAGDSSLFGKGDGAGKMTWGG